ncbi:MAG TPA: OB-fold domain-containing protein [Steroidobacteraceae bacterium]|nr:OB-fold domain-containing protein [Steroidobacteraceae bacterium]
MTGVAAELPMFADHIVGFGPPPESRPHLLGGRCAACDRWFFPVAERCTGCYGPLEVVNLGAHGTVYSCTLVRTKPPLGLPRPYAVAWVDLAGPPLRIFMLVDPSLATSVAIGQSVELGVGPVGVDRHGAACRRPYFTPVGPR